MKKYGLIFAILCLGLTACGVKGPLYYPENAPQQTESK